MQIPLFKVFLPPKEALMPRLEEILYSGQVSEGTPVEEFEQQFMKVFDTPNTISYYSGTAALHGALMLAGVEPGDEVISTAMTAEPSNMAIMHAGGKIVWADVDPRNGNIDPKSIEEKITPRTKCILAVHYGGIPASIKGLREVAKKHGIPVIEDAAHALGAKYNGRLIGRDSEYTMFSLQAIKHMTTIDGGMLACLSPEDAHKGKIQRWFGIDRKANRVTMDITMVGYKYHMNNVNATIGLVQLDYIQDVINKHIENGKYLDKALSGISGIDICRWDAEAEPSYWFYTVFVQDQQDFIKRLESKGIAASTIHKRNDLHTVFKDSKTDLPNLDKYASTVVHIPCGWWMGAAEREYMVDVIKKG
jgi:dTDP-4-amino-4,6-dideoxygalactose transaminase